jgi:D-alanyl-D-alanine dipeptidase
MVIIHYKLNIIDIMKKLLSFALLLIGLIFGACSTTQNIKEQSFMYIDAYIPDIQLDIRYYGSHNFTGRPVVGYNKPVALLTVQAAMALKKVQGALKEKGLGLKVFDAYRPQRSVDYFEQWAKDVEDTIAKQEFYPDVDKRDLFKLNYIASRSGHSRGSTVDLTLIDLSTKTELDMGSAFDLFGTISHHGTTAISAEQEVNRNILKNAMLEHGFKLYPEEWWHYTLVAEPFTDTYFDFEVE